MRRKPEILATAGSFEEIEAVIRAGADAVSIGENHLGVRMPGDFTIDQIQDAITSIHELGAKAYVSVNNIYENDILPEVESYLIKLNEWQPDAVVFGDPSIIMIIKQHQLNLNLHWNPEMTATNYATAKYWKAKGASRVVLARELNLEEIHESKQQLPEMEVQVQVHGLTNIYHSKRSLLQSYMDHLGKDGQEDTSQERGLFLVEEERQELKFPIYEDQNGTHVMSAEDMCLIEVLDELLEVDLDSLKIDGLLKSISYNETCVRVYREAVDAFYADPEGYECKPEWIETIKKIQDPDRELDYGFLFKMQVY